VDFAIADLPCYPARRRRRSFGDSSSGLFGVLSDTRKIQHNTTLVADDPGIVSGWHEEEVSDGKDPRPTR
jgi:hypothetical protein